MTLQISISKLIADSGIQFGASGACCPASRVCGSYPRAFFQAVAVGTKGILLGQDLRPAGTAFARPVLRQWNRRVSKRLLGILPTPALASYPLTYDLTAIMVAGSHIPFDGNRITFYRSTGGNSKANEAEKVAAGIGDSGTYSLALSVADTSLARHCRNGYLDFFWPGLLAGLSIGIYQHSRVARGLLRELLTALGAQAIALGRSDGLLPIDTEVVSEEDQLLARQWVAEHRLDALLSPDGDADRTLNCKEHSDWLWGDIVGSLRSAYLAADAVVTPVSCNTVIERLGKFRVVRRAWIGSPSVIDGMKQAVSADYQTVVGYGAGGFLLGTSVTKHGKPSAALPIRAALLPMLALFVMSIEAGRRFLNRLASCTARPQPAIASRTCNSAKPRFVGKTKQRC